jgi:hypothetical protein
MILDHWNSSADTSAMLTYLFPLHGEGSTQQQPRLLQLYFASLARLNWAKLPEVMRIIVQLGEIYSDIDPQNKHTISLDALSDQINEINEPYFNYRFEDDDDEDLCEWSQMLFDWTTKIRALGIYVPDQESPLAQVNSETWNQLTLLCCYPFSKRVPPINWIKKKFHRADLLRELYPFPARREEGSTVTDPYDQQNRVDHVFTDQDVVDLAGTIYCEYKFGLLPILGDCLTEKGCSEFSVVQHCHDETVKHVKGCWVLDRILTKQIRHSFALEAWTEIQKAR